MEASLEQGLEPINPGPTVAVNTTNQLGGSLELSLSLSSLFFSSALYLFLGHIEHINCHLFTFSL